MTPVVMSLVKKIRGGCIERIGRAKSELHELPLRTAKNATSYFYTVFQQHTDIKLEFLSTLNQT